MAITYCQTEKCCEDGRAGVIQSAILVCPENSKLLERAHRKANTEKPYTSDLLVIKVGIMISNHLQLMNTSFTASFK